MRRRRLRRTGLRSGCHHGSNRRGAESWNLRDFRTSAAEELLQRLEEAADERTLLLAGGHALHSSRSSRCFPVSFRGTSTTAV